MKRLIAVVSHDVSIILLDKAVTGIPFGKLPQVGLLDQMKKSGAIDTTYTNVGYGTHEKVKNAGGPADFPFDGDRWYSFSSYSALNQDDIHLHQKNNADEGGTCYGDSGGPTLATAPDGKELRLRRRQHRRCSLLVDEREQPHRHAGGPRLPRAVPRAQLSLR